MSYSRCPICECEMPASRPGLCSTCRAYYPAKHVHDYKRSRPNASVEICECREWRFTEHAGPSIVEVR